MSQVHSGTNLDRAATQHEAIYRDVIQSVASRYLVDERVVRRLYDQLKGSCATACSFDIPELGGAGEWSPGHVTGAPGADHSLRMRIDGLCSELAALIQGSETSAPEALTRKPHSAPASGRVDMPAGDSWWPASFGTPAASGDRFGMRYAFFPGARRLLIQQGARIDSHDTREYQVKGVAEMSGGTSELSFETDKGAVKLEEWKCVELH